jgi:DNA-binding winged helix-turn-helix (wHTH) protein
MSVDDALPAGGSEPIVFRSFRLDRRSGRLTRAGQSIPVRRKTWEVLLYLVDRPGVLVTKSELLDAVWRDLAVTPDVLIRSVRELRLALGDDSRTPRCIETVHRRGYRFIAEIQNSSSTSPVSGRRKDESQAKDEQPESAILVGRDAELWQLDDLFAKACAGRRQIVFVTGPAGVGKTALVETFLDSPRVHRAASLVWVGRGFCVEQHGAREAYMPVLDALDRLAHRPDAGRLAALLRRVAPTWLVQMPWLLGDSATAVRQSLQAAKPERMLREFAALIEALSTDLTVVLVLEDLHWSDTATVDLLTVLAQRREAARLLVIGTYRAAEAAVQHHALLQAVRAMQVRRQCVDLPLHELSEEDVRQYLDERFPGAEFGPALAQVLHDYTDGNPLFVVAVVEHMLSRGWILETSPGWALSTPVEKLQLEVPDDARRMIEMQFDSLSPADRSLLQAASIVGTEFALQPIAAALKCTVEDAEIRCDTLARTHSFLRFTGSTEWPDGSAAQLYAFSHELYRQAAYAEIPEGQRQRLHQRIGEAIEVAYGEHVTLVAPELAAHFERSHDHARAVVYLAAAAARAGQRFANREAVGYLETALAVAAMLPDARARLVRELELRLALGPALNDVDGFASESVQNNYERAHDICTEVGSPEQLFQVLYALGHLYAVRSDEMLAPKLAAELDDLATHLGSGAHRLLADSISIRVAVEAGRCVEACRLAEKRLPAPSDATVLQLPFAYGVDPLNDAHCHYAFALWLLGHSERARTVMRDCLAAGQRTGSIFSRVAALWFTGLLELCGRRPAAALEPVNQAIQLSTECGFSFWGAVASALRGWAMVQSGEIREGIAALKGARTAHAATGARLFSTHILAFLASAYLGVGDIDAGLEAIDESLAVAESTLDRSYWPELLRLKGELLLRADRQQARVHSSRDVRSRAANSRLSTGNHSEAEECLLRAVQVARESEAKSLELRAATSLAGAWREQGRTADARLLLAELCEWFGAAAQSPDLTEARALLAHLSTAAPGRGHAPAASRRAGRSRPQRLRRQ